MKNARLRGFSFRASGSELFSKIKTIFREKKYNMIWKVQKYVQLVIPSLLYCKSGNFRENFNFANSVKRHICDAKNLRLAHDLHISVKDRVISAYRKDFIFTKLRICEVSRK